MDGTNEAEGLEVPGMQHAWWITMHAPHTHECFFPERAFVYIYIYIDTGPGSLTSAISLEKSSSAAPSCAQPPLQQSTHLRFQTSGGAQRTYATKTGETHMLPLL